MQSLAATAVAAVTSGPAAAATPAATPASTADGSDAADLARDRLGTHKVLVLATAHRRVVGLASWTGQVLWARTFPHLTQIRFVQVRHATMHDPVGVLVALDERNQQTVVLAIDPVTGEEVPNALPAGFSVPWRPLWVHAISPATATAGYGLLLADGRGHAELVHVRVGDASAHAEPPVLPGVRHLYGVVPAAAGRVTLMGYTVAEAANGQVRAQMAWVLPFDETERIVATATHSPYEHVANVGRALGNRSVLYKYLNPHLYAVATMDGGAFFWRGGGGEGKGFGRAAVLASAHAAAGRGR